MKEVYTPVQRAHHRHRHQLGGTDQTRGQLISGPKDFLYQRHFNHLRIHRRERSGSRQRHGYGCADRQALSRRLAGVRRKLLSERPERVHQDFRSNSATTLDCLAKEVQRINAEQMNRFMKKDCRHPLGAQRQEDRRAGTGLHGRTRMTFVFLRRLSCASGCKKKGRSCGSTIPRRWKRPKPCCRMSPTLTT